MSNIKHARARFSIMPDGRLVNNRDGKPVPADATHVDGYHVGAVRAAIEQDTFVEEADCTGPAAPARESEAPIEADARALLARAGSWDALSALFQKLFEEDQPGKQNVQGPSQEAHDVASDDGAPQGAA